MRLVVDPRPADMGGRGAIQEFFLDRVLVEPGDGGQPPGDGGVCPPFGFQVTGEGLDVGAADGEQGNRAGPAPGGELAQVERVGLTGQAAVSGQEPGEGESLGIGEGRLDRGERGGRGGSGHRAPPGRAETREAGPAAGPSDQAETHRKLRPPVTPGHSPLEPKPRPVAERCSRSPNICSSPRTDAIAGSSTDRPVQGGPQRRPRRRAAPGAVGPGAARLRSRRLRQPLGCLARSWASRPS